MTFTSRQALPYLLLLAVGLLAPFVFPDYSNEIAVLWLMIVFASTWDILGGQMGYNSLGNIFFFGAGMYICAVVQIGLYYDVGMYTSGARTTHIVFTTAQYFTGFALGTVAAGLASAALAIAAGWIVFGLRGPYFAIGTLGLAIAAAELVSSWEWVGAAAGISMPVFPAGPETQKIFFYFLFFALAFGLLVFLRWLYSTNFGLALNAIRDDEEKAEAMGLHTRRYKRTAWAISAVFLGIAGAIFGNMTGFIEPRDIAFPTTTFNLFMVVMVLLGGKGTLWGPVIGAVIFHIIKEVTWTYFLGWQFIALGVLIVVTIVYFQQGIVGWLMEKYPKLFVPAAAPKREQEPALRGGACAASRGRRMSDAIIELKNVTKSYGGVIANHAVSLSVPRGGITGLIGPNGSGKTTLFNSIVGYHPIDSGSIRFEGREISQLRVQEIARLGMLRTFQTTRIYGKMTCMQNMLISIPHRKAGLIDMFATERGEVVERAEQLLAFVGLYEKRDLRSGSLSFGQQKLLEFAMALMNEPTVLLLDEPTAGINPTLINGLLDRLKRANTEFGITLFIIEHNMRVIMNTASKIYCMAHGEMLAAGEPGEIQRDQRVIDAYLGAN